MQAVKIFFFLAMMEVNDAFSEIFRYFFSRNTTQNLKKPFLIPEELWNMADFYHPQVSFLNEKKILMF